MRKSFIVALAVVLTASFASAQLKVQPRRTAPAGKNPLVVTGATQKSISSFPRISREDAAKLYKQGKAVFIDVRSNESFRQGHIRGALGIPGSQIVRRYAEVPVKKTVITYCACDAEQSSGRAVAELMAHGVKNVYALKGGWNEWKAAGLPTAVGPK